MKDNDLIDVKLVGGPADGMIKRVTYGTQWIPVYTCDPDRTNQLYQDADLNEEIKVVTHEYEINHKKLTAYYYCYVGPEKQEVKKPDKDWDWEDLIRHLDDRDKKQFVLHCSVQTGEKVKPLLMVVDKLVQP